MGANMTERIFVLIAAFGCIMLFDWMNLKNKINKGEKAVYLVLMLISLYLGFDYAINKDWFDLYDLIEPVFGGAAKEIEGFLKVGK